MAIAIAFVISWLYSNAVVWGLIRLDERYLCDEGRLERAWLPSSRDTAVLFFGPIALIRHFLWTRISFKSVHAVFVGLIVGLAMAVLAIAAWVVALTALDVVFWVLGLPDSD